MKALGSLLILAAGAGATYLGFVLLFWIMNEVAS